MKKIFTLIIALLLFNTTQNGFASDNFVIITPEKSGTHLLTKLITQITQKQVYNCWEHTIDSIKLTNLLDQLKAEQKIFQMHALPTDEIITTLKKLNYKVIFLIRDPRDILVSLYYYIEKGWSMGPLNTNLAYGHLDKESKMTELIGGSRFKFKPIEAIVIRRLKWMQQPKSFVYISHFENLVGEMGGGSRSKQIKEISQICNFISTKLPICEINNIANSLWGNEEGKPTTFRQGLIGSWKQEFNSYQQRLFKKNYSKLLQKLGYAI